MSSKPSKNFNTIQKMVRDHLKDAEKNYTGPARKDNPLDNPGPTPVQAYASAFSTATGAYGGGGITVTEWQGLQEEIREHQVAHR